MVKRAWLIFPITTASPQYSIFAPNRSKVPRKRQTFLLICNRTSWGRGHLIHCSLMPFSVGPPNLDYFWEMGSAYICILGSLSSGYTCREKGPLGSGLVDRSACPKETCPVSPSSPGLEKIAGGYFGWQGHVGWRSISASSLLLLSADGAFLQGGTRYMVAFRKRSLLFLSPGMAFLYPFLSWPTLHLFLHETFSFPDNLFSLYP